MTERFSEMARELRDKECPHSKQKVRGRTYEAIYCDECVAAALRSGDAKARLSGMCIVLAAWAEQDWDKAEELGVK